MTSCIGILGFNKKEKTISAIHLVISVNDPASGIPKAIFIFSQQDLALIISYIQYNFSVYKFFYIFGHTNDWSKNVSAFYGKLKLLFPDAYSWNSDGQPIFKARISDEGIFISENDSEMELAL